MESLPSSCASLCRLEARRNFWDKPDQCVLTFPQMTGDCIYPHGEQAPGAGVSPRLKAPPLRARPDLRDKTKTARIYSHAQMMRDSAPTETQNLSSPPSFTVNVPIHMSSPCQECMSAVIVYNGLSSHKPRRKCAHYYSDRSHKV